MTTITSDISAAPANATPTTQAWQVPAYEAHLLRPRRHDTCLVVPVINEGPRLHSLLRRVQALDLPKTCVDVVLVDGGSSDGSLELNALRALDVGALLVKTGPGKLSAQLRCAYAWALQNGYAGIVTIDGNDKDDPAAIPAFVRALAAGTDFVQASRYVAGGAAQNTPRLRELAIRYLHAPALARASGFAWTDTTQGFRAYSRRLLQDPRVAPFRAVFSGYELLAYLSYRAPRLGYRCVELPTSRRYPRGKVPTKIGMVRGNLQLLRVLAAACSGRYNPAK